MGGEPFFKTAFTVEWDAVGVPTVSWQRSGFHDWGTRRVPKHKPHGRRRSSRDGVRATEGGVR
jgi:hypothetical protein